MEEWKLSWSKLILLIDKNIQSLQANLAGAYRLSKFENGKAIVFYVGKTEDIKKALEEHMANGSNDCVKTTIEIYSKCYFRYSIIGNDEVRSACLKQMFKVYKPSCNDELPEGRDDITVNLN